MSFRTSPYSWYNPFAYTSSGVTLDNYQSLDPYWGDPLGFGQTGLFACTDDGEPCTWTWPPQDREGGIDWWGLLEGAWEFFNEVIRPSLEESEEERRQRQVQLAQSGAVTSGWFILLVVGAIVAAVVFTGEG